MKPVLEIHNVAKKFYLNHSPGGYQSLRERMLNVLQFEKNEMEDFWALEDISFSVNNGESIGIIGRNGAGKSTLLKILSRITPPTKGKIISRGRIASLLEVGTGFHPELTGRENIFFNGSLLGMRRKEVISKFDEIISFSGTEKFLDTPLKHYSSGMQLRLAFSVAAFLEPEILIIDEVLAVGDAGFQKKCLGKMEDVSKSGRTILFVSHNMAAVSQLCNSAILLDSGRIIKEGPSKEVIDVYTNLEDAEFDMNSTEIELAKGVSLKDWSLKHHTVSSLNDLSFSFSIHSHTQNTISGLALLIYNSLNERVGILDFRNGDLSKRSTEQNLIHIEGEIKRIPLLEGVYYVGLFISSNLHQGDYYKLAKFEVLPVTRDVLPYELKYRGAVEFDHDFVIR